MRLIRDGEKGGGGGGGRGRYGVKRRYGGKKEDYIPVATLSPPE